MLFLALTLLFADPQDAPAQAPPAQAVAAASTHDQAAADARAAADAADAALQRAEVEERAAICREAREGKARITAAAVRLGERDPDLMRAWLAADRIERVAC